MKYEYKVYRNLTAWLLNKYGAQGWELVSVTPVRRSGTCDHMYYLKRPVQTAQVTEQETKSLTYL